MLQLRRHLIFLIFTAGLLLSSMSFAPVVSAFSSGDLASYSFSHGEEKSAFATRGGPGTAIQSHWPPNRGFASSPVKQTLKKGARIDRYGYEGGSFLSPEGTPYGARSLAPGTASKPYNVYEVVKPIKVDSGQVAPWFGELGGGTQYELPMSVADGIKGGYLKRVTP